MPSSVSLIAKQIRLKIEVIGMNMRQILLASTAAMLLTTSPAWSGGENGNHGRGNNCQGNSCGGGSFRAPEIDAASGTSAIALLTGIILLMKERTRSRRSSKAGESKLDE
jgi:S-adenosylmethionine synthetase